MYAAEKYAGGTIILGLHDGWSMMEHIMNTDFKAKCGRRPIGLICWRIGGRSALPAMQTN